MLKKLSFLSDSIYSTIITIINAVYALIFLVLSIHYLPFDDYGRYVYVMSVITIARLTLLPGIEKYFMGYAADGQKDNINRIVIFGIASGLTGIIGILIFSEIISDTIIKNLLYISAIGYIPYFIFQRTYQILSGLRLFYLMMWLRLAFVSIAIVTNVIIFEIFNANVYLFLTANMLITSIFHILIYCYVYFFIDFRDPNIEIPFKLVRLDAFKLTISGIPATILEPLVAIYIGESLGVSTLAAFNIAVKVYRQIENINKSMIKPIALRYYQFKKTIMNFTEIVKFLFLGCIITLIIYIILFIFPVELLEDKYIQIIGMFKLLCISLLISPLMSMLVFHINLKKYTLVYFLTLNASLVIKVIFIFLLNYLYGITGILTAYVLTAYFSLIVYLSFIRKHEAPT